jgi:hypothetical protein
MDYGLRLSPEIILNTNDIVFIGWMFGIGVLPDLGDHSPAFEAYQSVALALR